MPKALSAAIQEIKAAWRSTGQELLGEDPYITKSALKQFIINKGIAENTASQAIKPSAKGKLVNKLIDADIIKEELNGFVITHGETASALLLNRG